MDSARAFCDPRFHHSQRALVPRLRRRSSRIRCAGGGDHSQSFLHRLGEAWSVVLGLQSTEAGTRRVAKQRFSKLLVTDRGFDAEKLSHFYSLAKAAISEHVVLEDKQGKATVERLGELQLQFNVKRIKSSAQNEPWAVPTLIEYEPE